MGAVCRAGIIAELRYHARRYLLLDLDQIHRDNVKDLRLAWTLRMDNFSSPPEFRSETSPVMANGRLFFTAGVTRAVVAANAGTGELT